MLNYRDRSLPSLRRQDRGGIREDEMKRQVFGALVASALTGMLAAGTAQAADKKAAPKGAPAKSEAKGEAAKTEPAKGDDKADSAKCVHNCQGYAECKGNGSDSCKGKNSCANEGLVPKECSSQTTADGCGKVVDKKNEKMCTWLDS
jgi:hypothetical protein